MKKTIVGSLAAAALMSTSAAMADVTNNSLTTKGYVDAGLNYLYNRYEPVRTDVSSLKTTVGDSTGGLVKRVTDLENNSSAAAVTQLQSDVQSLQSSVGAPASGQTAATGLYLELEGKQDTIDSAHKLDADLVDDTNSTNKFVTDAEKQAISTNTQDISGLQSDVSDLQDQIDAIDVPEYVAGAGITITDGTGANAGKKVIAADVATTWDASVLVTP